MVSERNNPGSEVTGNSLLSAGPVFHCLSHGKLFSRSYSYIASIKEFNPPILSSLKAN